MREDDRAQHKKFREDRMNKVGRDVYKKLVVSKANNCLKQVEKLVRKEIENGKSVNEAVNSIKDNKTITKIYTQLNDSKVQALVFKTIRARLKREEEQKNK